ncbi:MAG TPA: RNA polymerase sigma factor [Bacteroidia bacterium]|nr:RNA polymerase sigma factor [Bacteroidia bacterium]
MLSDADIVKGCIAGDAKVQQALYQKLAPKMLAVCYRYCNDRDDAKDVMHEAFVKVFLNMGRFKFNSSLETWITRIMINSAIDFFKKKTKMSALFENIKDGDDAEDTHEIDDPGSQVSEEILLQLIDELPKGSKMIFNLYAIEGLGHKDIAQMMGISEGTSKSQLSRARELLKKALKDKKLVE